MIKSHNVLRFLGPKQMRYQMMRKLSVADDLPYSSR